METIQNNIQNQDIPIIESNQPPNSGPEEVGITSTQFNGIRAMYFSENEDLANVSTINNRSFVFDKSLTF